VQASYGRVEEGITSRCNKINTWYVDLFHRRQLIKTVLIPSFNHIYMSLGFCAEAGQRVEIQILKLLFNIFIIFFIYIQRKTRDDEMERSPLVESLPLGYLFLNFAVQKVFLTIRV
jgi:hypothetical protein